MDGKKAYLPCIDSLKGISIIGVLIAHTNGFAAIGELFGVSLFSGGQIVYMLLLISCFLIFKSLQNCSSIKNWWIKKIIRIAPLYYPVLLISIAMGGNQYWLGSIGKITISNVITHILFLFDLYPYHANSIIGVEWYLGVLVILFVLSPFLFQRLNSFTKSLVAFLFTAPTIVIISHFVCNLVASDPDAEILTHYFSAYLFVNQIPMLLLGLILFFVFNSDLFDKWEGNKILSYALLFFGLILLAGQALGKNNIMGFNESISFGLIFFLIFLSQVIYPCPILCNRVFAFFGRYSYAVYLLHSIVIHFVSKWIARLSLSGLSYWLVLFSLTLLITLLLSVAVTKYYDIPVTKKLKNLLHV